MNAWPGLLTLLFASSVFAAPPQQREVVPGRYLAPVSIDVRTAHLQKTDNDRVFLSGDVRVVVDEVGRVVQLSAPVKGGERVRIGDVLATGGMPLEEVARKVPGCEVALLDEVMIGGRVIPCHGVALEDDGRGGLGAVRVVRDCAESDALGFIGGQLTSLGDGTTKLTLSFCGAKPVPLRMSAQVRLGKQIAPALIADGDRPWTWTVTTVLPKQPTGGRLCIKRINDPCAIERSVDSRHIAGMTR